MSDAATEALHILAVEDDTVNMELLRATLARAGGRLARARLRQAAALGPARTAVAEQDFDLVLLDRRLPDGDGLDLARELRQRQGKQPFIVALTADAVPATRLAATDAGCDELVTKPYQPATLLQLLERLLAGHAG